jgi:hypothetical protein
MNSNYFIIFAVVIACSLMLSGESSLLRLVAPAVNEIDTNSSPITVFYFYQMQLMKRTTKDLHLADVFVEKDAGMEERMEEATAEVIGTSTTETEETKKVEVNVLETNDGWASLELTPGSHQSTVLADALFGSQFESIYNQKSRQLWACCLHSYVFKLVRICPRCELYRL